MSRAEQRGHPGLVEVQPPLEGHGDQRGHERVSCADRVDHVDRLGGDLHRAGAAERLGSAAALGHHHEPGAAGREQVGGDVGGGAVRGERVDVLVAHLHQVGVRGDLGHVLPGLRRRRQEHRPGVGVVADEDPRRHGLVEQVDDGVAAGTQRGADGTDVQAGGAGRKGAWGQRPAQVEVVGGRPVGVEVGGGGAGAVAGDPAALVQDDAAGLDVLAHPVAVVVVAELGHQHGLEPEPGEPHGHVERRAARGVDALALGRDHDVDEGLSGHDERKATGHEGAQCS